MDSAGFIAFRRSVARGWGFLVHAGGWKLDAFGVALALLLVQLLLIALSGVRTVALTALERGAVHLDVVDGTSDQKVQELYAALNAMPSVRDVRYVTREQVFVEESARDPSLVDFLARYGMENPFSDALVVTPTDAGSYADLRAFAQLEQYRDVIDTAALSDIGTQQTSTAELLEAVDTARTGVELLVLLAIIVTGVLAFNLLVRLAAARRPHAKAEKLAGATAGILAFPAVTAGVIALLGALAASFMFSAIVIVTLALLPLSAAVAAWVGEAFLIGLLPSVPAVILAEGVALVGLSWVVGRAGSSFRV